MRHFISSYGYLAILLLMTAESACIPVPSELTMPLGGAIAAGAVAASRRSRVLGGRSGIERARRWSDRYGGRPVFIVRLLPAVRTFISLPAGYARMRPVRFAAYTAAGCVPRIGGQAWAGYAAEANRQHVQRTAAEAAAGLPVTASGRPGTHRR